MALDVDILNMILNLNLLDPVHRKALVRERFMIIIKDVTIMTLGTVAFIATLLIISKLVLSRDLQEATERTNIITSTPFV